MLLLSLSLLLLVLVAVLGSESGLLSDGHHGVSTRGEQCRDQLNKRRLVRLLRAWFRARGDGPSRRFAGLPCNPDNFPISEVSSSQELIPGLQALASQDLIPAAHRVVPRMAQRPKTGAVIKGTSSALAANNVQPNRARNPMSNKFMLLESLLGATVPCPRSRAQIAHTKASSGASVTPRSTNLGYAVLKSTLWSTADLIAKDHSRWLLSMMSCQGAGSTRGSGKLEKQGAFVHNHVRFGESLWQKLVALAWDASEARKASGPLDMAAEVAMSMRCLMSASVLLQPSILSTCS